MTATVRPYSTKNDLLLDEGGLVLGEVMDVDKFVITAGEEIDAKLGFLYRIPLTVNTALVDDNGTPLTALPDFELLLLKSINNRLASGRLLLTIRGAADGDRVHAYGQLLVTEATNELNMIANGEVPLSALHRNTNTETVNASQRGPASVNHDDVSLVDAFEDQVFRQRPLRVFPGTGVPATPPVYGEPWVR